MKYGRNQINKYGEIIMSSKVQKDVDNAITIVNDWRTLHLPVLDRLQRSIMAIVDRYKIKPTFISRRLKRLTSIISKLDNNPLMRLGGMQDIGGFRIVLNDIDDLNKLFATLNNEIPEQFNLEKTMDYITKPKYSGYRSIHFIYKFKSENVELDGMKVELQIRTKLQHSWAMAVETAGLITQTSLKSSQGDNKWLVFFKIVSSLFAIKEKLPILIEHQENKMDMFSLMRALYRINKENNFSDTLKALKVSNTVAKKEGFIDGYYILNINFETKKVTIRTFPMERENDATQLYEQFEKHLNLSKNAVVLVSVPKVKELVEAYPSYFLNTEDFIKSVDIMMDNCTKNNIV